MRGGSRLRVGARVNAGVPVPFSAPRWRINFKNLQCGCGAWICVDQLREHGVSPRHREYVAEARHFSVRQTERECVEALARFLWWGELEAA